MAMDAVSASESPEAMPQHWQSVAWRTRSVAEQWRMLHAGEEARAGEAIATAARAATAVRRAEEERDAALRKSEVAATALATAKQERARWRARADAQTASKTFLQLEDCQQALQRRDAELSATTAKLDAVQRDFDAYRAQRRRDDVEREAAARERLEALMCQREDALADARQLTADVERIRHELSEQLAASPPGALAALTAQCARHEAAIALLEQKNATLRREVTRWRERAKGALASERLTMLQAGPRAMALPVRAATAIGVCAAGGGLDSPRGASARGSPRGSGAGGGASMDELPRLRAELDYHRAEAERELLRQRSFQAALWSSDAFSLPQKQKATEMLRALGDGAEDDTPGLADLLGGPASAREPADAPLVGNLAVSRRGRAGLA